MTFGWALERLRAGFRVTRPGWNGKGMCLELQTPDAHSKMTEPYIFLITGDARSFFAKRVPWVASQTDLLAEDWQ